MLVNKAMETVDGAPIMSKKQLKKSIASNKQALLKATRAAENLPSVRATRRHRAAHAPEPIVNDNLPVVTDLDPKLKDIFLPMGGVPVSIRTLSDVDRPFSLNENINPSWKISHIIDYGIFGERRKSVEFFLVAFKEQPENCNRWLLMEQIRRLPGFTEEVDRTWFKHFQQVQKALRKH